MPRLIVMLALLAGCPLPEDDGKPVPDEDAPDTAAEDTAGADGGDDSGAPPDDTGDGETCGVAVEETVPADGATDADWRARLEFHLDEPDATALVVTDIPGHQEVHVDGDVIYWVPDAPLAPGTTYTATLEYCGGSPTLTFTTSSLGTPLEDGASPVGTAYALDVLDARVVEPGGIGAVFAIYTGDLLLEVGAADGAGIALTGAPVDSDASAPAQDLCMPSADFALGDFSASPWFESGVAHLSLGLAGFHIELEEARVSGTFASDARSIGGATLSGWMDTRPLAPLIDSENEAAICEMALSFGDTCTSCPSDGEPFCLYYQLDQIDGAAVPGLALQDVAGEGCDGCDTWTQETVPPVEEQVCP